MQYVNCINSSDQEQIKRDLNRTYPQYPFFKEGNIGLVQLERVLVTFVKYNPKIGYVQGMNFIVGALLFHCSEDIAFWLFVSLIERYGFKNIYSPGFPGLHNHIKILDKKIAINTPLIYDHFVIFNINLE